MYALNYFINGNWYMYGPVFLQSNWLLVSPYNMIQTTFSTFAENHSFFKFLFCHRTLSKIDEILILFYFWTILILDKQFENVRITYIYQPMCRSCKKLVFVWRTICHVINNLLTRLHGPYYRNMKPSHLLMALETLGHTS